MRRLLFISICLIMSSIVKADPFEDFKTYIVDDPKGLIKPFAQDFGGLLGANDVSSGRSVGFPGFDIGLSAVIQSKPDDKNLVLKKAGVDSFGLALLNASIGLPFTGMDVMVRGVSYTGLSIVGGGLRYNIFKSGVLTKFFPDLSACFIYDHIDYDYFKGNHISLDLAASLDFPVIKPFAAVGVDRTSLEIKNVNSSVNGIDASISKMRYTAGARITIIPFTYLYGAYSSLHGVSAYNIGLGARF